MSKYQKGFNLSKAKRLAEVIRSDYKNYIQPSNSYTAICILLDHVEKLEKENKKLKQDCILFSITTIPVLIMLFTRLGRWFSDLTDKVNDYEA